MLFHSDYVCGATAHPCRRSQFDHLGFARHPKLTQETTIYDEQFGENRRS